MSCELCAEQVTITAEINGVSKKDVITGFGDGTSSTDSAGQLRCTNPACSRLPVSQKEPCKSCHSSTHVKHNPLIEVAHHVRGTIIQNCDSTNKCYSVSSAIKRELGNQVTLEETDMIDTDHWFLTLPNGQVLDATLDQFNERFETIFPEIYLGDPIFGIHTLE